jgi:hypothetical protein
LQVQAIIAKPVAIRSKEEKSHDPPLDPVRG